MSYETTFTDTSLDALGSSTEMPTTSTEMLNELVVAHPLSAVLASAAVGAGLMALLSLIARDDSPRVSSAMNGVGKQRDSHAERYADRSSHAVDAAADHYADLKSQIGELAKKLAASLPSRSDADDAMNTASDKAAEVWNSVRKQADDVLGQLRPHMDATAEVARAHPVWTALAVGALGALLGSQITGGGNGDSKHETHH